MTSHSTVPFLLQSGIETEELRDDKGITVTPEYFEKMNRRVAR
jgi:hypothetical protein